MQACARAAAAEAALARALAEAVQEIPPSGNKAAASAAEADDAPAVGVAAAGRDDAASDGNGSNGAEPAPDVNALQERAREAELAAAAQTRRAAAAEAEAEALRGRLSTAQDEVRQLGWQLQMATGTAAPTTVGGRSNGAALGGVPGATGWFADMLGCGANYTRK